MGCAYVTARRRVARRRADLPLALQPKISEVRLTERLGVDITLSPQGRYRTSLRPVEGDISVALVFGHSDRDRLNRYARKRASDRTSGSAQAAWSCTAPSTSRRSRTFLVLSADSRGPPGRIRCSRRGSARVQPLSAGADVSAGPGAGDQGRAGLGHALARSRV